MHPASGGTQAAADCPSICWCLCALACLNAVLPVPRGQAAEGDLKALLNETRCVLEKLAVSYLRSVLASTLLSA